MLKLIVLIINFIARGLWKIQAEDIVYEYTNLSSRPLIRWQADTASG